MHIPTVSCVNPTRFACNSQRDSLRRRSLWEDLRQKGTSVSVGDSYMYNHSPPNTAYNFHRTVLSDGLPRLASLLIMPPFGTPFDGGPFGRTSGSGKEGGCPPGPEEGNQPPASDGHNICGRILESGSPSPTLTKHDYHSCLRCSFVTSLRLRRKREDVTSSMVGL